MSKPHLTVFLCTGKDCKRAWRDLCDASPGKWLKREVEAAGLSCKLEIVKTECMDRCEQAANLWLVHEEHARLETDVTRDDDVARLLAAVRDLVGEDCQRPPLGVVSSD